jgi:hypothetical protein
MGESERRIALRAILVDNYKNIGKYILDLKKLSMMREKT